MPVTRHSLGVPGPSLGRHCYLRPGRPRSLSTLRPIEPFAVGHLQGRREPEHIRRGRNQKRRVQLEFLAFMATPGVATHSDSPKGQKRSFRPQIAVRRMASHAH